MNRAVPIGIAASALAAFTTVAFTTVAFTAVDARAAEGPNRFSTTMSAGWMHTSVFSVPIDTAAISLGIGFTHQRPHGFGVDIHGTIGARVGRTKAGRSVGGFEPSGVALVFHYDWFRIGLGTALGAMNVERSTNGESQGGLYATVYGSVGVEPLAVSGRPLFVEAQFHQVAWSDRDMNAFVLAVGARFCGAGCMP